MYVFIDIETVPASDFPDLSLPVSAPVREDFSAPANYKDPAKIEEAITAKWLAALERHEREVIEAAAKREQEHRAEALQSLTARIVSMAWAVDDGEIKSTVNTHAEAALMAELWDDLRCTNPGHAITWVTFNGATFDLPIIKHRAAKYGMTDLLAQMPTGRWDKAKSLDIRDDWTNGDSRARGKLDEIAAFLGVGCKSEGMDGSKVYDAWREFRHDEISAYNVQDVALLRAVFCKLRPNHHIACALAGRCLREGGAQ